jgi:hypothetical protein
VLNFILKLLERYLYILVTRIYRIKRMNGINRQPKSFNVPNFPWSTVANILPIVSGNINMDAPMNRKIIINSNLNPPLKF